MFTKGEVDRAVFGHSHAAMSVRRDNALLFDPWLPVAGRGKQGNSYGVLELDDTIVPRIGLNDTS